MSTGCSPLTTAAAANHSRSCGFVVDHAHGAAAQHVAGPHHDRVADIGGHGAGGLEVARVARTRRRDVQARQQAPAAGAVLGAVDRLDPGAQQRDAGRVQVARQVQRRLPAERDDDAVGVLDLDDVHHLFEPQRLEVQAIGQVVVGADGLGVAVDQDGLDAFGPQRLHGVAAAGVELDALTDAVGAAAQHDHLAPVGRAALAGTVLPGASTGRACPRGIRPRRCPRGGRRGADPAPAAPPAPAPRAGAPWRPDPGPAPARRPTAAAARCGGR